MAKIKIACLFPIPNDPTSFYRGLAPMLRLEQSHPDNIEVNVLQAADWSTLMGHDLLFLQRPAAPDHFGAMCIAKDLKIPVWVDFDDDNLSVPKDNPTYYQYNQMAIKDAIIKLARHADLLTVTTEFLKKKYGIYNTNTVVIPNALDDKLFHLRQIPPGPREKRIVWRGTGSHQRNLMSVATSLIDTAKKHEDWKFTFFGIDPIDITDHIKNHEVVGQLPILNYYQTLCALHATCFYYPLIKTDHAQARSHISWLEATFSSAATIAYRNNEFTRPGCLNYSTNEEFETVLENVLSGAIDIDKHVDDSWMAIQEHYVLSKTNLLRLQAIEGLLS